MTSQSDYTEEEDQASVVVMGTEFIGKIKRQNMQKQRRSKSANRPKSQSRRNLLVSPMIPMPALHQNGRMRSANTPPLPVVNGLEVHAKTVKKSKKRSTLFSESSDDNGSFKASSRISKKRKSSHSPARSGNRTVKFEKTGNSFTQQLIYRE